MRKFFLKFTFLLATLSVLFAKAQNKPQYDSIANVLKEVVISSMHINDSLMKAPAAIGILSASDLTRNNATDISFTVNTIAGVYMQSGGYNTNRISIRGIGARTPYGTNKIRAFYGDIPLTSGDSETTIEDIDLENIAQVEIIKGPLSSVYGGGLGGAILLQPKLSSRFGNMLSVSTTHGSFGLMKNTLGYIYTSANSSVNLSYHKLQSDGWRENSSYAREGITLAGELFKKSKGKLTYFGNYTFMKAFIPSSINRQAYDSSPKQAAANWLAAKGFERYNSYLFGFSYDSKLTQKLRNSTSVFFNHKESDEPRPFDILTQDTFGYGARTQFSGVLDDRKKWQFLFGGEYFRDGFKGNTFENLYQQNNGLGSIAGEIISENKQKRHFINGFAQLRHLLSKRFEIQAGLNVNKTSFELQGQFPDQSKYDYSYDAIWSPQLSVLYKPSEKQTFYFSASRGFSLPSVEETLTANGSVNTDIKPESGYNFEIGQKAWLADNKFYLEISAYRMLIANLLVAQRIGDDQYIGVNAGKTRHQGIEITVNHTSKIAFGISMDSYAALSAGDYEFRKFNHNGNEYSGNNITGVPANKANAGILLKKNGVYFSADYQFVDAFPMTDANAIYSDSYQLLNLKAGWRFGLHRNLTAHLSGGINNVTNEKYASMVLVNATSTATSTPRYYYPGLPENYYLNFSLKHSF